MKWPHNNTVAIRIQKDAIKQLLFQYIYEIDSIIDSTWHHAGNINELKRDSLRHFGLSSVRKRRENNHE
jgi:hypothetical protein